MRIPLKKIYRAFPQLDQFSDDQCERFVLRAREARGSLETQTTAIVISVFASIAFMCMVQFTMWDAAHMSFRVFLRPNAAADLAIAIFILLWVLIPAFAGLLARDAVLWRQLKHAIWRRIEKIRCPRCSYSLLGQQVQVTEIRCPECGHRTTLQELGLGSADDLMPPDELTSAVH